MRHSIRQGAEARQVAGEHCVAGVGCTLLAFEPGGPTQALCRPAAAPQTAARHLCGFQDELHLEIKRLAGKKARQLHQKPKGAARRQKLTVLRVRQRADLHAEVRLLIPEATAGHRVRTQCVISSGRPQTRAVALGNRQPPSDELMQLDGHAEVITQQALQRTGGPRRLRQEPGVEQQRPVVDGQSSVQPVRAHPEQVEQVMRKAVVRLFMRQGSLVGDGEAVLFPGAVEERDDAVVEQVEEIAQRAVLLLRYLLALEKEEDSPIVLFAHSQGGIILEHAIEFLEPNERSHLRIFTFGGGSFIASAKSHSDSHNYASVSDYVCLMGSPNLQMLALQRYHAHKEGLTDAQMIHEWAFRDAILELDSIDSDVIKKFAEGRVKYYQDMFARIKNLTILDPDPDSRWKHEFASDCYQNTVRQIIQKYRK